MRRKTGWLALLLIPTLGAMAALPPNIEQALEAQWTLAAEQTGDPSVLNDLGNLLVLANSLAEAEQIYRRALELAPDSAEVRYNLALTLQQLDAPREAMRELRQVISLEPRNAWAHYQVGTIHEAAGRRSKAIRSYGRALELDPDLILPEVNAQIIRNRLVTESMITAGWSVREGKLAPRQYQDPTRISELLVPSVPEPLEAPEPGPTEADREDGTGRSGSTSAGYVRVQPPTGVTSGSARALAGSGYDREPTELEAGSARYETDATTSGTGTGLSDDDYEKEREGGSTQVLTESDLVPSYVGQVSSGNRNRGAAPPSVGAIGRLTPSGVPVPPTTSTGRQPGSLIPGSTGPGVTVPPPTGSEPPFNPLPSSTGRLEPRLLPHPGDQLAAVSIPSSETL